MLGYFSLLQNHQGLHYHYLEKTQTPFLNITPQKRTVISHSGNIFKSIMHMRVLLCDRHTFKKDICILALVFDLNYTNFLIQVKEKFIIK